MEKIRSICSRILGIPEQGETFKNKEDTEPIRIVIMSVIEKKKKLSREEKYKYSAGGVGYFKSNLWIRLTDKITLEQWPKECNAKRKAMCPSRTISLNYEGNQSVQSPGRLLF